MNSTTPRPLSEWTTTDHQLITDPTEIAHVLSSLGLEDDGWGLLFVCTSNGDYVRVLAMECSVPWLHKLAWPIYAPALV